MNRGVNLFWGILVLGLLVFTCNVQASSQTAYSSYGVNHAGTALTRHEYNPSGGSTEGMLQEYMAKLNMRERVGDEQSLLPAEVLIDSYILDNHILTLQMSESYRMLSPGREVLTRAGIVYTFLQLPEIEQVTIKAGRYALEDSDGKVLEKLKLEDFAEIDGDGVNSFRYDSFTLYFANAQGDRLVRETRNVYYKRNLKREKVILEQLARGPLEKGHYPTIPENTAVNSLEVLDGVCYVDLGNAFLNYPLDVEPRIAVYSVVNSLAGTDRVQEVQISVGGREDVRLSEKLSLYQYFRFSKRLIEEE